MPDRDEARISGPEVLLQLTGTNAAAQSCILLGIQRGEMHIRADKWIEPASRVVAMFARINLPGEVLYSTRKGTWYLICVAIDSSNYLNRRDARLSVLQPAKVSEDGSKSSRGIILDLSVSGMRVRTSHYVKPGTMIFIEIDRNLVVGEVRHCREEGNGHFDAGIEITDILSDIASPQGSRGLLKNIRHKLAQAILGEPITIA